MRLTTRDLVLLTRMGEQYAVRTDDFGAIAGTAPTRTLQLLARYRKAGLVKTGRFLHGEPAYHWLTRKGLHELDLPYKEVPPSPLLLRHHHFVNVVRHILETRPETASGEWVSERSIRQQGRSFSHPPDGLLVLNEKHIAIEVELVQKSAQRQEEIAKDLAAFDEVWLFVAPGVHCSHFKHLPLTTEVLDI